MKNKFFFIKLFNKGLLTNMILSRLWKADTNNHFIKNICWGLGIVIMLQFADNTGIGQDMINKAHDVLVMKDFKKEVLESNDQNAISNDIRMIVFDKETYEHKKYPGGKYWTPRKLLGNALIKTIEKGATVVAVDFTLEKPVPATCVNEKCVDENALYLNLLQKAADIARKKNCVIIIPKIKPENNATDYTKAYHRLIEGNSDVMISGNPLIYKNSQDKIVRHFNFFQTSKSHDIVFSVPVLAAIYHWFGKEKGDEFIQKAKAEIKAKKEISLIQSNYNTMQKIQLFYQDSQKECLAARYKFRILPKKVIHEKFGGGKIPSDLVIQPFIVLNPYFDQKRIKGKIVVIGSDYPDFGDIHQTPFGKIAGVYLIANVMNMFMMGDQVKEIHFVLKFSILLVWIVIASLLYTHLNHILSFLILIVLLISINTPVSVWIFSKWGIFMDFWLPVSIMGIRENIESTINFFLSIISKKEEK